MSEKKPPVPKLPQRATGEPHWPSAWVLQWHQADGYPPRPRAGGKSGEFEILGGDARSAMERGGRAINETIAAQYIGPFLFGVVPRPDLLVDGARLAASMWESSIAAGEKQEEDDDGAFD